MKKLLYVFAITLLFFSCSDENNLVDISNEDLVGTWNLTQLSSSVTTETTFEEQTMISKSTIEGKDYGFSFDFSQNPNEYTTEGSLTLVVKTDINGLTQTEEYETDAVADFESGSWEIKGNKLIINGEADVPSEVIIDSYTENKLILKQKINENQLRRGATIKITGTATIVLERAVLIDTIR